MIDACLAFRLHYRIYGFGGSDLLEGGEGNDILYGNLSTDTLFGSEGDDVLYGGFMADSLVGGPGFDVIYGEVDHTRHPLTK